MPGQNGGFMPLIPIESKFGEGKEGILIPNFQMGSVNGHSGQFFA